MFDLSYLSFADLLPLRNRFLSEYDAAPDDRRDVSNLAVLSIKTSSTQELIF